MSSPLVLVTGSTDGIGLETARQLVERGTSVIIHGRNPEKVAATHASVSKSAKQPLPEPLVVDLGSLQGAHTLASELQKRNLRPTVLINNAGIFLHSFQKSPDGIELTMAVNYFSHFVLTHDLLAQPGCALERIVNVSSGVHSGAQIDLEDIELVKAPFEGYEAYAASKLALVLFTVELAKRRPGVAINALHPGVISTKLLTQGFGSSGHDTMASGAKTPVMLALMPDYRKVTGEYFAYGRKATMSPTALDAAFAKAFYEKSAARVGLILN